MSPLRVWHLLVPPCAFITWRLSGLLIPAIAPLLFFITYTLSSKTNNVNIDISRSDKLKNVVHPRGPQPKGVTFSFGTPQQSNSLFLALPNELLDMILGHMYPFSASNLRVCTFDDRHYLWQLRLVCRKLNLLLECRLFSYVRIKTSMQYLYEIEERLRLYALDRRFNNIIQTLEIGSSDTQWGQLKGPSDYHPFSVLASKSDSAALRNERELRPAVIQRLVGCFLNNTKESDNKLSLNYPYIPAFAIAIAWGRRPINNLDCLRKISLYAPPKFIAGIVLELTRTVARSPNLVDLGINDDCGQTDLRGLWRALLDSNIKLKSLRSTVVDEELIRYLASYSGLHELNITVTVPDVASRSDEIANLFFNNALVRHSDTLTSLKITANRQGMWCLGNLHAAILPQCRRIGTLVVSANTSCDGSDPRMEDSIISATTMIVVLSAGLSLLSQVIIQVPSPKRIPSLRYIRPSPAIESMIGPYTPGIVNPSEDMDVRFSTIGAINPNRHPTKITITALSFRKELTLDVSEGLARYVVVNPQTASFMF